MILTVCRSRRFENLLDSNFEWGTEHTPATIRQSAGKDKAGRQATHAPASSLVCVRSARAAHGKRGRDERPARTERFRRPNGWGTQRGKLRSLTQLLLGRCPRWLRPGACSPLVAWFAGESELMLSSRKDEPGMMCGRRGEAGMRSDRRWAAIFIFVHICKFAVWPPSFPLSPPPRIK